VPNPTADSITSDPITPDSVAAAFIAPIRETLLEGMHKIEHCVGQLNDQRLWWRPRPEMNSIANLMLHLSGNLRQWIVSGVGGAADIRNRPLEFSDRSNRTREELIAILKKTVMESDAALARVTPAHLLSHRRIQGFDKTAAAAIVQAIPHFRGHVQEIIHMTREQIGEKYRFDFVPKGKEQTAAGATS
jgi:hypothetical protein